MNKKLISIVTYVSIGLVFFAFVLIDYFIFKPAFGINTDGGYWIGQGIAIICILTIMILVRYAEKNRLIEKNKNIETYQTRLNQHFKVIVNNSLYEDLETFIKKHNEESKYETFVRRLDYKISKCKDFEKRKKLIELQKTPKEEVLKMNIKYTKISSSDLYSNVYSRASDDPNQINIREGRDVAKMVVRKTLMIVISSLFAFSVVPDFVYSGPSAFYSTLLKVIVFASAVIGATSQAQKFVNGDIEAALKKRVRISIAFINSNEEYKSMFGLVEDVKEEE